MANRSINDCLEIMALAVSRRNPNDPDSDRTIFLKYINDFVQLTMSDDLKIFEEFGTLIFTIDASNKSGVYTFNEVGASDNFVNISQEGFISLLNPVNDSVSWNILDIYQDPGEFFYMWGINNDDILIPGYPTMMLYYGTKLTFRTIPNDTYQVQIYGYKEIPAFASVGNPNLPFAYWLRYVAYGAAMNYVRDFTYDEDKRRQVTADFQHEKKLLLTRTHNQVKQNRCLPRF